MPTRREQIVSKAIEILQNTPQGVRYSDLVNNVKEVFPDIPINTIHGVIWDLDARIPEKVYKVARGLFRYIPYREVQAVTEAETKLPSVIREENFYPSFADYLKNELEEVTKAIPLGGNAFRDKWGTPDVIGIEKSMPSDIVRHEVVIVSAEIKTDTSGLITSFGQACAYRIFSHKTYIVIPKNSSEEDKSRLESLCLIYGIGLIYFNSSNTENPQYEIRVRPLKFEPDMFYTNKYMKIIEDRLFT